MAAPPSAYQDRHFLAVIGDEVNILAPFKCAGLTLSRILSLVFYLQESGYGRHEPHRNSSLSRNKSLVTYFKHVTQPPDAQKNFLVVDAKTEISTIEQAFDNFTQKRKDIGILLINQHVRPRNGHGNGRPKFWLMIYLDCREDKKPSRYLHRSFPCGVGSTKQRSSLRPREG